VSTDKSVGGEPQPCKPSGIRKPDAKHNARNSVGRRYRKTKRPESAKNNNGINLRSERPIHRPSLRLHSHKLGKSNLMCERCTFYTPPSSAMYTANPVICADCGHFICSCILPETLHEVKPSINGNNGSATNTDDVKGKKKNTPKVKKQVRKEVRREERQIHREPRAPKYPRQTALGRLGQALGDGVASIFGFGDYRARTSSVQAAYEKGGMALAWKEHMKNPLSMSSEALGVMERNDETYITHRDYIGSISGTSAFNNTTYLLNAANSSFFKWLATIAPSWTNFELLACIVEYQERSSNYATGSALGEVIMQTNYNPNLPAPTAVDQMYNSEYTTAESPDKSFVHPLELNPDRTPLPIKSVIQGTGQPLLEVAYGNFNIATNGNAGTNVIGDLFVEYRVKLLIPVLPAPGAALEVPCGSAYVMGHSNPAGITTLSITPSVSNNPDVTYSFAGAVITINIAAPGTWILVYRSEWNGLPNTMSTIGAISGFSGATAHPLLLNSSGIGTITAASASGAAAANTASQTSLGAAVGNIPSDFFLATVVTTGFSSSLLMRVPIYTSSATVPFWGSLFTVPIPSGTTLSSVKPVVLGEDRLAFLEQCFRNVALSSQAPFVGAAYGVSTSSSSSVKAFVSSAVTGQDDSSSDEVELVEDSSGALRLPSSLFTPSNSPNGGVPLSSSLLGLVSNYVAQKSTSNKK